MIKIGLFGFGCVGQGLYEVLNHSSGFRAEIKKIGIRDGSKKRSLPAHFFTTDPSAILDDAEIQLVVELIDDAEAAWHITRRALEQGKSVVSANKKMIAYHLPELVDLQNAHGGALLYEGSVCGSIPILRNLEEYYDNETLAGVSGIFNGSSNYVLTKIFRENIDYDSALRQAQAFGFAETDPWLDVAGYDAKHKLVIATAHAFGLFVHPADVLNLGIQNLAEEDVRFAREMDCIIRLVVRAQRSDDNRVVLSVLPQFIPQNHPLYNIDHEYNAVVVESAFAQQQLFIGKGAGGHPTGAAVLSDISARQYQYKYEYKKRRQQHPLQANDDFVLPVYARYRATDFPEGINLENGYVVEGQGEWRVALGETTIGDLRRLQASLERSSAFVAGMEYCAFAAWPAAAHSDALFY